VRAEPVTGSKQESILGVLIILTRTASRKEARSLTGQKQEQRNSLNCWCGERRGQARRRLGIGMPKLSHRHPIYTFTEVSSKPKNTKN
jgi:hypothetical protein